MLKILGDYITSLLDFDPEKVIIGRENFTRLNTSDNLIILDYLSSTNLGSTSSYDGDNEILSLVNMVRYRITIATFGDSASDNINNLSLMLKSQKSLELQTELGIRVGYSFGFKNLKKLDGSIYTDFYEIEVNVDANSVANVDTLRIDTPQFEIRNEDGVIL